MNTWRDTIPEIPDDLEIRENVAPAKAPQTESRDPSVALPVETVAAAESGRQGQPSVEPVAAAESGRQGQPSVAEVAKTVELIADDVPPLLVAILEELKIISSKLEEFSS